MRYVGLVSCILFLFLLKIDSPEERHSCISFFFVIFNNMLLPPPLFVHNSSYPLPSIPPTTHGKYRFGWSIKKCLHQDRYYIGFSILWKGRKLFCLVFFSLFLLLCLCIVYPLKKKGKKKKGKEKCPFVSLIFECWTLMQKIQIYMKAIFRYKYEAWKWKIFCLMMHLFLPL